MNINNLPTDNLYKFLAISGLFIVGFSIAYPQIKIYELRLELINITVEQKVLDIETDRLVVEQERLKSRVEQFQGLAPKLLKGIKGDKNRALNEINDMGAASNLLEEKATQSSIKLASLKGKVKRLEFLNENLNFYIKFKKIGISFGLALAFTGFYFWYSRVQRYADTKIRKEARSERRKIGFAK